MSWKSRLLGFGAAAALGLSAVGPAAAQTSIGDVDVSVQIQEGGAGAINAVITSGESESFGIYALDAAEIATSGVLDAGTVLIQIQVTGDDQLYRDGGSINIVLGDGSAAGANLDLTSGDPTFLSANQANFQIPGRYLSVSALGNPQQLKWTGGTTSSGAIWDGTGVGRAPRAAGSAVSGSPIYKVGDIFGSFNTANEGCRVTTGGAGVLTNWNEICGESEFSELNISKTIAGIYPGSGFVTATHDIELSLTVPAGVYPGTYQGTLTLERSFS